MERDEASFEEKIGMSNGAEVCLGEARLNKTTPSFTLHTVCTSTDCGTRICMIHI